MQKTSNYTTENALCVYYIFHNGIAFNNYFIPKAWHNKKYVTRYYQYIVVLADDAIVIGGRSWGKSITLEASVVKSMVNGYGMESVLTAFRKLHIRDREEKIISYFENIAYLKMFLYGKEHTIRESINRSPIYTIKLLNGHIHYGISIGDDPLAVNIQGTHPFYRYIEESQFFPREAWIKFQGARDPRGSYDKFIGVTDGRSKTPYADLKSGQIEKFKDCRFRISRRMEPYFDQKTKQEALDAFRSESSNEFLQQVDAKDGEPVFGYWNIYDIQMNFDRTEKPGHPNILEYAMKTYEITPKEYKDKEPSQVLYDLPRLPNEDLMVIMAIDAGFSQPSMILPFFKWRGKWNLWFRVALRDKVNFDDQAEIIDYLADYIHANMIMIDCSSSEGKAIALSLQNPKNMEYAAKKYNERIPWAEFQKSFIIGYQEKDEKEEPIEIPAKIHTSNMLYKMFINREFNIYSDEDMLVEFNREHQKTLPSGYNTIFTPADIHIPDAFRCFAYGIWLLQSDVAQHIRNEEVDIEGDWDISEGDLDFGLFGRQPRKRI